MYPFKMCGNTAWMRRKKVCGRGKLMVCNWQLLGLLDPQDENPRMGMEHLLDCLDSELRFDICDLGSS